MKGCASHHRDWLMTVTALKHFSCLDEISNGPRFLDSSLSEISARHYAAFFAMGLAPYTASGVCRFNAW